MEILLIKWAYWCLFYKEFLTKQVGQQRVVYQILAQQHKQFQSSIFQKISQLQPQSQKISPSTLSLLDYIEND